MESFDELIQYTYNILSESISKPAIYKERLDEEKVYKFIIHRCHFDLTDVQEIVFRSLLSNSSNEQLEKLYFKNNLTAFVRTKKFKQFVPEFICNDWLDSLSVPDRLKTKVNEFLDLVGYYCFYTYQYENKLKKAVKLKREVILLSDTDSTFIYLDKYIKWVNKEFYDNRELTPTENTNATCIINSIITKFIRLSFDELTKNYNVEEDDRASVAMKNEYLFKRVMLTRNKKQYASLMLAQEGVIFEKPKLDIKGIPIKKVSTPKAARKFFSDILEYDIIKSDNIDPLKVLTKFIQYEKDIKNNILSGNSSYLKPAKFGKISIYKTPYRIQSVRGALLWNTLFPKRSITEDSNVNILKLKSYSFEEIKEKKMLPDNMIETIEEKYMVIPELAAFGLDVIAIPKGTNDIPKEFINLIDINIIVNNIVRNGNILLESLGFKTLKSLKFETASNLISF